MAHITGGGLIDNIPRVLPHNCSAEIDPASWKMPEVFKWLQQTGNIQQQEMYRTFNCGVGMVLVVDASITDKCIQQLQNLGEKAWKLGQIVETSGDQSVIFKSL